MQSYFVLIIFLKNEKGSQEVCFDQHFFIEIAIFKR